MQERGELTDEQKAEIEALERLPDDQVDTRDIPEVLDWSDGRRGCSTGPGTSLWSEDQETAMTVQRQRFSSRVDSELLAALRELAKKEGRPFSVVLEDVMRDYVAARQVRPAALDEWWPPHPTARLAEGVSLRREDMYEDRV